MHWFIVKKKVYDVKYRSRWDLQLFFWNIFRCV